MYIMCALYVQVRSAVDSKYRKPIPRDYDYPESPEAPPGIYGVRSPPVIPALEAKDAM